MARRPVPVAMTGRESKPAAGKVTAIRGAAITLADAADAFLSSPRAASPNTRRAYAGVIDRLAAELGPHRQLAAITGGEIAAALRRLWGTRAPATRNRNRAAVASWLNWCATRKRWPAPQLPGDSERYADDRRLAIQATTGLRGLPISPWAGLGVLAAWAAGALLLGGALLKMRDA